MAVYNDFKQMCLHAVQLKLCLLNVCLELSGYELSTEYKCRPVTITFLLINVNQRKTNTI